MTTEPMTHVHFIGLLNKAAHTDDPEVLASLQSAVMDNEVDFVNYIGETLDLANELKMTLKGIEAEQKRLDNLHMERTQRIERLEKMVQWVLEQVGQTEWHNDLHTVRLKRNPPKVVIESEAMVPRAFIKETYEVKETIDKRAIKDALENGIPVEGCKLTQDWRLEVR